MWPHSWCARQTRPDGAPASPCHQVRCIRRAQTRRTRPLPCGRTRSRCQQRPHVQECSRDQTPHGSLCCHALGHGNVPGKDRRTRPLYCILIQSRGPFGVVRVGRHSVSAATTRQQHVDVPRQANVPPSPSKRVNVIQNTHQFRCSCTTTQTCNANNAPHWRLQVQGAAWPGHRSHKLQ